MKRIYYLIIAILVIISGIFIIFHFSHDKPKLVKSVSLNNTRPIKELKKLVLSKGDTIAYKELSIAYLNVPFYEEEYLLYSIIMADKYKFPKAYFNVYWCLTSIFEFHIYTGKIDEKTKDLALKYLKEGVELNDGESTHVLSELYLEGKYVPKDSILGKKLAEKEKSCW
jgi:cellulose synthase/poly-beta-1,6-N-acetylglucosamine synthase-like glycosyltransferase